MIERFDDFFQRVLEEVINKTRENLSQDEKIEFEEKLKNADYSEIYMEMLSEVANQEAEHIKSNMYESVLIHRQREEEVVARINQKWLNSFVTSELLYNFVLEIANEYFNLVNELDQEIREEKVHTYISIKYLHGRALQQFSEIITLMRNGFADGAYARWRSMYEIIIIASFILKYGEEVAKEFINAKKYR